MPNPAWERIARQIEAGYRKAGGAALNHAIMDIKVKCGSTFLTRIYHRQSPLRVLQGGSDAAPVWSTEAYFQQQVLHHPVETVAIPAAQNVIAACTAARMRNAPHQQAAKDFLAFMRSRAPTRSIENTASCRRTEQIAMRCRDPRRPIFAHSLVITPWRSRAWRTRPMRQPAPAKAARRIRAAASA